MANGPASAGADVSSAARTASFTLTTAAHPNSDIQPGNINKMELNKLSYNSSPPPNNAIQHVSFDRQLLNAMMDYTASLFQHAKSIVRTVKAEHYFDIGLDIVKLMVNLEDNHANEQIMKQILQIDQLASQEIFRKKLAAFLLHGESFLRCVHEDLPPERNPFLWHWMAIVKDYKPPNEGFAIATEVRGVWHLRYEYVKTLLQGTILDRESPASFERMIADGAGSRAPPMDFSKFDQALHELGISDDEIDTEQDNFGDESPPLTDGKSKQNGQTVEEGRQPDKTVLQAALAPSAEYLESTFINATTLEIGEQEGTALAEMMRKQPSLLTSTFLTTVSSFVPALVRTSPQFAKVTIYTLLELTVTISESSLEMVEARNNLLWSLGRLPADLSSMDLITTLLISRSPGFKAEPLVSDPEVLIHAYLATALRALEGIGFSSRDLGQSHGMASSSFSANTSSSAGEALLASLGGQTGREAQARVVELLLLFIKNLLRREIVTLRDLRFEIQELGVRYIFVPAAREFWQDSQKVLYDSKAKDFDE